MDDHPCTIFASFSDVFDCFRMFSDVFCVMFGHFWRFLDIPDRIGMFPDDSGVFQIVFKLFRSGGSPEKSDLFKNVRRLIFCCWPNKKIVGNRLKWMLTKFRRDWN